jgi:hypothetical protein
MSEPRDIPGITFPPPQPHEVNGPVNPSVRYEHTDVNTRGVLWFVVALAAGIIIVMLVLWGLFHLFLRREAAQKKSDYPLAVQQRGQQPLPEQLPPSPRLEGLSVKGLEMPPGRVYQPDASVQHDIGRVRASSANVLYRQQERELNGYGWVRGEKDKVAHIPIEEAMKRLADKLPARKGEKTDKRNEFLGEPSGTSSGRVPREGGR